MLGLLKSLIRPEEVHQASGKLEDASILGQSHVRRTRVAQPLLAASVHAVIIAAHSWHAGQPRFGLSICGNAIAVMSSALHVVLCSPDAATHGAAI